MSYEWVTGGRYQHWLHRAATSPTGRLSTAPVGLVYEIYPEMFSVFIESPGQNPYARTFLGWQPTLDEAKNLLVTIAASQQL